MKRAIFILGCAALAVFVAWFIGIALELEYSYTLTLMQVRHAVSVRGKPFSEILKADGANWASGYHWHTCSYCADAFGEHKNLTLVRLSSPYENMSYYFAYCRPTHVLVPLMDRTAAHFPSLIPLGDELRPVGELDGTGRTTSFGEGDLKLPRNWYRAATGAEPQRAADRNQPLGSPYFREPGAAGSGR